VDELGAVVGLARTQGPAPDMDRVLESVQRQLFVIGSDLATPGAEDPAGIRLPAGSERALEAAIDAWERELAPLRVFILAGGAPLAAWLHLARTVCRRAERRVVALDRAEPVGPAVLAYLNRLSDLLFVMARLANHRAACPDVPARGERDP
jgi:ATP:cob(I)alamin adenosyltransferase